MIPLEQTSDGVVLCIKPHPGAHRNAITGSHDGALKVAVSQAPEKGKAMAAILALLAKSLRLKKNQFELLSGQTSTQKKILIRGISAEELTQKIQAVLGELDLECGDSAANE